MSRHLVGFVRLLCLWLALLVAPARAEFSAEKLALIDRPFVGDQLALSPDGRYLAYTQHSADRHTLFIADLDRKVKKTIPLTIGQRTDRAYRRLLVLRWISADRLVLQEADGQVVSLSADGSGAVKLWNSGDDGLVQSSEMRSLGYWIVPSPPRLPAAALDDHDHILLESVATIGPESFSNLFRVDVRTAETELLNRTAYLPWQVALYGPGDLLFQPGAMTIADSILKIGLQLTDDLPPPRSEVAAGIREFIKNFSRREIRIELDKNGLAAVSASEGAPATSDSSSSGRMLYDREGWPRILYERSPFEETRRFSYTEPGKPAMEPNITPTTLDEFLGVRTRRDVRLGLNGEFEIRPRNWFGERSYPLAFDFDPDVVYIASSKARDTFGIYSLNLKTRERKELAPEITGIDLASGDPDDGAEMLVFDEAKRRLVGLRFTTLRPRTHWFDPELAELQAAADRLLPREAVEILSWDNARTRFVLRASSESEPGVIFVYHRAEDRLEPISNRAPWLASTELKPSVPFTFKAPAGHELGGYLTLPIKALVDPPPLLIYCAAGLWERPEPGFNREAEMLADMGIAVMRLNYRGTAGFGRAHLTAIKDGVDSVPLEDMIAAVDWLAKGRPIDRKRVIVMGEGFGGYLALRALQLRPDVFRCAITINAPTNLRAWAQRRVLTSGFKPLKFTNFNSEDNHQPLDYSSLVRAQFFKDANREPPDISEEVANGTFRKPVLLISNPRSSDLTPLSSLLGFAGLGLEGMTVQRMSMSGDFVGGTLETRTKVFQRIEEFLNYNLYQYDTELGTLKEVQPPPGKR